MTDLLAARGLPCNIDAERLVLGSILLDGEKYALVAAAISAEDFSLETHRRIFTRMGDLHRRGEPIDRVTVYDELGRNKEAESCGGLSCLVSLDEGLPQIPHLDGYIRILQEKTVLRSAIVAAQHLINRCVEARDGAAEILSDAEAFLSRLADGQQKDRKWLNPGEVMMTHPGGIDAFIHPPRGVAGTPTPWPNITADLCGMHRGDLMLVAGRPSMGKSVIAGQIAYHTAALGEGVAFFSLEMTSESLVRRLISAVGGIDAQKFRSGRLDRDEQRRVAETAAQIKALPLFINDNRARTIPAVMAALRKLVPRHLIRLVIIDHLQLMNGTGRIENRHQELSEISHSLKHLAGEMDVTVVLLSQLNRDCEKDARQPRLADLKETGSLEEDADVVLFVHRPEQYRRTDLTLKGKAEFIIGKQRNGPTGKRNMLFEHEFQRFAEVTGAAEVDV